MPPPTKPPPLSEEVLLEFPTYSFPEMQTHAWMSYIRRRISAEIGTNEVIAPNDAWRYISEKLTGLDEQGGDLTRTKINKYVPEKTVALVEKALPGSAPVYYWGPDCSQLWAAIAEQDEGLALRQFLGLTGLTYRDLDQGTSKLISTILDISPNVALHALAALWSHASRSLESEMELHELVPQEQLGFHGVSSFYSNPWIGKLITCLEHPATEQRLQIYDIDELTPFYQFSGKPKTCRTDGKAISEEWRSMDLFSTILIKVNDWPTTFPLSPTHNLASDEMPLGDFAKLIYQMNASGEANWKRRDNSGTP